ncbi:unnamed protein product [Spirodela intermedia]|uniref:Uncharacterized protein n=1 Tax=Spirodela intermedia TaxID=51605 RepID=A0ABN7EB75_SPIIN|nr:unnamed protein product [Spirodela intermedia]
MSVEELDGGGAHVRDFILRSAQQEEALHRIWYALRRWRLVSRRIVLFPTTASARAPARGYSPTALPTRLRARLAGGSPHFAIFLFLFLVLHLSQN